MGWSLPSGSAFGGHDRAGLATLLSPLPREPLDLQRDNGWGDRPRSSKARRVTGSVTRNPSPSPDVGAACRAPRRPAWRLGRPVARPAGGRQRSGRAERVGLTRRARAGGAGGGEEAAPPGPEPRGPTRWRRRQRRRRPGPSGRPRARALTRAGAASAMAARVRLFSSGRPVGVGAARRRRRRRSSRPASEFLPGGRELRPSRVPRRPFKQELRSRPGPKARAAPPAARRTARPRPAAFRHGGRGSRPGAPGHPPSPGLRSGCGGAGGRAAGPASQAAVGRGRPSGLALAGAATRRRSPMGPARAPNPLQGAGA